MTKKEKDAHIYFYNDNGVLIGSYNCFYNILYGGKGLKSSELDEIKGVLDKKTKKTWRFFSMEEGCEE